MAVTYCHKESRIEFWTLPLVPLVGAWEWSVPTFLALCFPASIYEHCILFIKFMRGSALHEPPPLKTTRNVGNEN